MNILNLMINEIFGIESSTAALSQLGAVLYIESKVTKGASHSLIDNDVQVKPKPAPTTTVTAESSQQSSAAERAACSLSFSCLFITGC